MAGGFATRVMRMRLALAALALLAAACAPAGAAPGTGWLYGLTGEEQLSAQLRGVWQLAVDQLRPRLNLQPDAVIALAPVNPYGINTFLEQEVEPARRAQQVQMIADAGFHWLRQEFPWYDIEVHGKMILRTGAMCRRAVRGKSTMR